MNIRLITVDRLTRDEIAAWSEIQERNPLLASPYFRPEFTQAVAAVRADVEVAVLEDAGQPVGFFPFQRTPWNTGRPVAGRLSDFHGVIISPDVTYDPLEMIRACRLSSWQFDHLVRGPQRLFAPYAWREEESPYIDLSGGFEAYAAQRGRKLFVKHGQKRRKLEREIGPIRFEPHVADRAVLEKCIAWKVEQYRRTGMQNIFAFAWARRLLVRIMDFNSDHFAPVLSVLYAGDEVAAICFGMRSGSTLHPWFPAYNVELARYSPGILHWIESMRVASSSGIRRIELGKGPEPYKHCLMNGATRVAVGAVDLLPTVAFVRRALRHTLARVRSSALRGPASLPGWALSRIQSQLELR